MEEPPPLLRIVILDAGPEAELLKQDLEAVPSVGEVQVVRRVGQAHALLARDFNALCIDLFDPAVRPEQGVKFIETVRREFPHVPICLFSEAEELEILPGVDSKWSERLRHYLQVAAENSQELPQKARELAGDFRMYLSRFPERVSGAPAQTLESGTSSASAVDHLAPPPPEASSRAAAPSVQQSAAPPAEGAEAFEPLASPPAESNSPAQTAVPPADAIEQSASPQAKGAAPPADTPAQSAAQQVQSSAPARDAPPALDLDGAYALLRRALGSLAGGEPGRMVRDEEIRQWMEETEPRFDFKDLGFARFSRFLTTARQVEVVELRRRADGHYEAALPAGKEPSGGISASSEPEAPLAETGRRAVALAAQLGSSELSASIPYSIRLLAGILIARPADGNPGTATFLVTYLAELRPGAGDDPVNLLSLADPGFKEVGPYPYPAAAWAAEGGDAEQLAIQQRALELATALVRNDPAEKSTPQPARVSARHLLAAIVAPGGPALPALEYLETLGCRLDDLRRRFFRHLRARELDEKLDAWRTFLLPGGLLPLGFAENAPAAAYDSDADGGRDRLNITPEVNALAAVLASKELEPPLAVGLFGDWGTGKSFFMRRMRTRVRDLAREARAGTAPGICPNIVQIPFNAWHYMDANLWASLVTGVFDGLANALRGAETPAVVRERLLGKLAENHAVLVEAERRLAATDAAADRARRKLDDLATQKAGLREVLASGGEVVKAAFAQPEVRGELSQVAREVGLPPEVLRQAPEALERLHTWRGKLRTAWRVVTGQAGDRRRLLKTAGFAVLIVAVAAIAWWLATQLSGSEIARGLAAAVGVVLGVAARLAPILQKLRAAQPRVEAIVASARKAADASAADVEAKKADAERELAGVEQEEAAARQAQTEAVRRRQEIEEEIAEIQAGRRLHRFISERSAAEDYRRHLGLVALIRNDFQHLSTLLRDARSDRGGLPPVDRIILYIDDLDRCPERRVVEVLQAVHLLLAFKLFVVVVGVDSRWLLRSVESHYSQLRADREPSAPADDEEGDDEATPQNYLEKIFQIPFTLRPMDPGGYRDLIGSLIRVPGDAPEEEEPEDDEEWTDPLPAAPPPPASPPEPADAPPPAAAPLAEVVAGDGDAEADGADVGAGSTPAPPPAADAGAAEEDAFVGEAGSPPAAEEIPESAGTAAADGEAQAGEAIDAQAVQQALVIEEPERAFLQQLSPLIPSPRSAKRLVNVYRFIRASLTPDVLGQFRGSDGFPGEYQAVALLLAVLTGFPTQAVELFRALNGAGTEGATWWAFCDTVQRGEVDPARWEQFKAALAQVQREVKLDDALEPFVRWAPHVARFSFQTGQIFARRHG